MITDCKTCMQLRLLIVFLLLPFLCGARSVALTDIETAILEKNYTQAQELARQFIAQNPSKEELDEAHYYLGLSLLRAGKHAQARELFQELLRYSPEKKLRDKVHLGIVDSYYMDERYEDALAQAESLLKESRHSEFESLIYLKLARSNLKLTRWDKARDYLNTIVQQFPDSPESPIARQLLEENQYFAVQVGSFLERARAEKLATELKQRNMYAYIVETTDKAGRTFYRVRIGQLTLLKDAKNLENELSALGYPAQIYP